MIFEQNKKYWFELSTFKGRNVSIKGEVLEETPYLIKIRRDTGEENIIACARIVDVNLERNSRKAEEANTV